MNAFELAQPRSLEEAMGLLREKKGKARVLAGGTDLIPLAQERVIEPERLVSLRGVEGLDRIEIDEKALRLGALVTLVDLASDPRIRSGWPALSEGAGAAASPQIRNAGTVGGNLCQRPRCWYFRNEDYRCRKKGGEEGFALEGENKYHAIFVGEECRIVHPSDTAPALIAFEATAAIASRSGTRTIRLEEFFSLPSVDIARENILGPDEILTEVRVPRPPAGTRSAYVKIREKESFDFALASCAAVLTFEGTTCTKARIVLGGVAPVPWRCPEAEKVLTGHPIDEALAVRAADAAVSGATPLAKNRYKVTLARNLVRRTLIGLAHP